MPKSKSKNAAPALSLETLSGSPQATQFFGEQVGRSLRPGDVVALYGELGTGKTTFVQGIARGLGRESASIKSPTFVLVREYPGDPSTRPAEGSAGLHTTLVHVDGYRLDGPSAAAWLDLDLIFSPRRVTLIEWAERFEGLLPERRLAVHLEHVSANRRRLRLEAVGDWPAEQVADLRSALAPPAAAQDTETEHADSGD